MILVDVHTHLDLLKDLDNVIERAKKTGVKAIITNGISDKNNRKALEIAQKYDIVKAALGIYPNEWKDIDKEIKFINQNKDKIIAVGEIGLDYHWKSNKEEQKEVFVKLLKLAKKMDKPVIVHSRKAEKDVIEILEKEGMKKVLMHCFTGNSELVRRAEKNGWYFSVPCSIFRSKDFRNLVKAVSVNRLLTETDAPYLAADPKEKSEPAHVLETVKKIAEIKGMDEVEVANNIYMNYQGLFL